MSLSDRWSNLNGTIENRVSAQLPNAFGDARGVESSGRLITWKMTKTYAPGPNYD